MYVCMYDICKTMMLLLAPLYVKYICVLQVYKAF
jgi:hypothetical protein